MHEARDMVSITELEGLLTQIDNDAGENSVLRSLYEYIMRRSTRRITEPGPALKWSSHWSFSASGCSRPMNSATSSISLLATLLGPRLGELTLGISSAPAADSFCVGCCGIFPPKCWTVYGRETPRRRPRRTYSHGQCSPPGFRSGESR